MLSLEKVKSELEKYNYTYNNNILCGHTKSKIKWGLPTGVVNVMAFEQSTSYLFGFSNNGVNLFPIQGDWNIADNLYISWSEINNFKMKNGLLENEMVIETQSMKIDMNNAKKGLLISIAIAVIALAIILIINTIPNVDISVLNSIDKLKYDLGDYKTEIPT